VWLFGKSEKIKIFSGSLLWELNTVCTPGPNILFNVITDKNEKNEKKTTSITIESSSLHWQA